MIPVTKSYLPDKKKYQSYVDQILSSGNLTNNGPLLIELEEKLAAYFDIKHVICVANGSLALQIAYKSLEFKEEAITSPFSFVATSSTLIWEGIKPLFSDINPSSYNLDTKKIESVITEKTTGIVPVHVYGNPCNVEEIQKIASKHNLKVVYDAAHAFGVNYNKKSILKYGDISALSFHATKLFHTIEGGALVTNNDELAYKIRAQINFGFNNNKEIQHIGINAKMNEFQAAMGLAVFSDIDKIINIRREISEKYKDELYGYLSFQEYDGKSSNNYSYFPVEFKDEKELLKIEKALNKNSIFPRRYFNPSLDTVSCFQNKETMANSRLISSKILCLPLYVGLKDIEIKKITEIIKQEIG